MSIDAADVPVQFDDVTGSEADTFPKPRAHGAAMMNHFGDVDDWQADRSADRGILYDRSLAYWREHVGDRDLEPHVAVEDFEADWLPSGDYALVLTSSRLKAGTGRDDDYRAYYEQYLKLREWGPEDDGERSLRKPPLALHVEINLMESTALGSHTYLTAASERSYRYNRISTEPKNIILVYFGKRGKFMNSVSCDSVEDARVPELWRARH